MLLVIYAEKEECEAQRNRKSVIWSFSLKKKRNARYLHICIE